MATSDMSLGGGAGFGAGYTPIRFAPLMSLTGPVMAPAAPAAPEVAAPMAPAMRLPQMSDMPDNAYMTGEMQQGTPGAGFVNPFSGMSGSQIARTGMDALSFFTNPLGFAAQYALTGQTPSQNFQGLFSGGLQGLLGGGGQQAAEVPLGPQMLSEKAQGGVASIGGIGGAAYNDAVSIALGGGASQEMADAAGRNAAGLVAQGMDPAAAVALASMTATGQVGPEMPGGMPAPGGFAQGLPGLSRNAFDLTAPVAPQTAQTFGLGQPSQIESSTQMGGLGGAESPFGGFTGGGWSAGDVAGAYSDSTGFE